MPKKRHKFYLFFTALGVFLLLFGTALLLVLQEAAPPVPPIPELEQTKQEEEKPEEEEPPDETQKSPQRLQSVNLSYEADISQTAIDEMENGRFIVETHLPEGRQRAEVFRMLRNRGGIFVVRDIDDQYFLLQSGAPRQALAESDIPLDSYALHRPGRIGHDGLSLMGITTAEPGDIPYLVMPKQFEARIISEIERVLPESLDQYAGAKLRLEPTRGGHLRMQIESVTQPDRSVVAINQTVPGL